MSPMPSNMYLFGCTAMPKDSNKFILSGPNGSPSYIYDASTDTWTSAAKLQFDRYGASLVNPFPFK